MPKQKCSPCLINVSLQWLYLGMSGYFVGALPSHCALPSVAGRVSLCSANWKVSFLLKFLLNDFESASCSLPLT